MRPRWVGTTRTTRCSGSSHSLGLHGAVLHLADYYVGLLAATILFIATNAGLIGISRLSWSLAEHRQLPSIFSQLHPRLPHAVVHDRVLLGAGEPADPVRRTPNVLGNLYSFGAMLSFTIAHVAVVALRIKDPDRERPYRMPWNVRDPRRADPDDGGDRRDRHLRRVDRRGRAAPRGALRRHPVDGGGNGRLRALPPPPGPRACAAATAFRAPSARRTSSELGYRTALVPIFGEDVSAAALRSAAKLIGEDGVLYAIFVLPVPSQLSLEAGLEAEEAQGRSVLESARIQARRAGIKIHTGLIRTRNPGAALVEEAERVGCRRDLLVDAARAGRRAADRPDRRLSAQQAPVPGDHRDREPPREAHPAGCSPSTSRARLTPCAGVAPPPAASVLSGCSAE